MISKEQTIPEVVVARPGARAVFDRYGLHGCGGRTGPKETIEFFARVHGVPLDRLLAELNAAGDDPAPAPAYEEDLGDSLYRRFFAAALIVLLVSGLGLGLALLLFTANRRSLQSLDLFRLTEAHGDVQIFGWLGLFVMGFACQGLPRFKYVRLWRPRLAALSFSIMIAGLLLRASAAVPGRVPAVLGLAGCILEAGAVGLFLVVMFRTLRQSEVRDPWDKYVSVSLAAFGVSALAEPVVYTALGFASGPATLVPRMAELLGPYRDVQLLGFASMMILGVAQRILPTAFGFRSVRPAVANVAFWILVSGLVLDVLCWLLFRETRRHGFAIGQWAGAGLFAAGGVWITLEIRGLTSKRADRSTKFIRAAFAWFVLGGVMLIAEPLYARAIGTHFSHGFHGAIRHALAVGFASLMIVGIASKVVPILKGIDIDALPGLVPVFVLLNAGNILRVAGEAVTDRFPDFGYPLLVASGPLVALGFVLWAAHMLRLIARRTDVRDDVKPECVSESMTPASVVRWFPATLEVFERFGLGQLRNPILRNTIGRRVTLRTVASMKGLDLSELVRALNSKALARQVIEV